MSRALLSCFAVLTLSACGGGPPGSGQCAFTPPGTVHWTIGGFYTSARLVDPKAIPLTAKIHVGETLNLLLEIQDGYCGSNDPPVLADWISTNPQVARISRLGDSGSGPVTGLSEAETVALTGLSPGDSVVYANVYGSRADLSYYCCPPCMDTSPAPPSCQHVPISFVRVE